MEFLVYVLTLGSFLMVFPYLSEGSKISLEMPTYKSLESDLEIKCTFEASIQIGDFKLHYGDSEVEVIYLIEEKKFQLRSNPRVTLEVTPGATIKEGSFIFKLKLLSCNDFTWYMCTGKDVDDSMKSENKTLQIYPQLKLSSDTRIHRVNEVSVFKCNVKVSKSSSPSLIWYKSFISSSNNLQSFPPAETSSNACSRTYESQLQYNISVLDVPQLVLLCQLRSLPAVVTQGNFSIEEMTTIAATISPQPVKAGLDPGSIVGIVLGITATIVLVVLLVWFLVIRPKRLKADGSSKDQGPEPNAKDYQPETKGEVNPAMDDKNDADNSPFTVYKNGGLSNPAMEEEIPNHMSGSQV